jgi:hypothetical protein
LYGLAIRAFKDDEAHEWNRLSLCWARGWTVLAWTFVRSLSWVENSNKDVFFSHFDSCVIFFYMAFLFFPPFSNHCHFHVNSLLSYICFPLEISSIHACGLPKMMLQ